MPATLRNPSIGVVRKAIHGRRKERPTWEIAGLFPKQGKWTENAYLKLTDERVRVELVDGFLEFLEVPTILHDRIVKFLFLALNRFVESIGRGEVFIGTTKTKLGADEIRMPDVLWVSDEKLKSYSPDYFDGANLVMEVLSPDSKSQKRDLVEKRRSYAAAGIGEYWIVNPQLHRITVLKLNGAEYAVHGEYRKGQKAASAMLPGFSVEVTEAFAGNKR